MQVHESIAQGMLKGISDPALRETYGSILNGNYAFQVLCLTPGIDPISKKPFHKAGAPIGYLTKTGGVVDACAVNRKGVPIAGIETSRDRFDGRKGFRCYCGNWSIQAPEEQPVLGGKERAQAVPPTRDQMLEINDRIIKSKKGSLQFVDGRAEYDGFALVQVAVNQGGLA